MPDTGLKEELGSAVDDAITDMVSRGELVKEENNSEEKKEDSEVSADGQAAEEFGKDAGEDRKESGAENNDSGNGPDDDGEADGELAEGESGDAEGAEDERQERKEKDSALHADSISDAALTRAVSVGLPLSVARNFPNEDALLQTVASLENISRETQQVEEPESEDDTDPFEGIPELDPEVYGEEAIQKFDKIVSIMRKQGDQIKALRAQQHEVERANQAAAQHEAEQWFDKQVADLGADYHDALGKGGSRSLPRGSKQFANRDAIANKVVVLMNGYNASGIAPPSHEEIFKEATRSVLGDEFDKIRERKLSKKLKERSGQHIQRAASQKTESVPDTVDETVALLNKKFTF